MKLEELITEAEKDAKINFTELGHEQIRNTDLIAKWLRHFINERVMLAKARQNYDIMFKDRRDYYLGYATAEVYQQEPPSDIKILKGDVGVYLNADPKLLEVKAIVTMQEEKVLYLENYIKALHSRGFNIKSAIEYVKFAGGQQ